VEDIIFRIQGYVHTWSEAENGRELRESAGTGDCGEAPSRESQRCAEVEDNGSKLEQSAEMVAGKLSSQQSFSAI
jgi:hypothetical protein